MYDLVISDLKICDLVISDLKIYDLRMYDLIICKEHFSHSTIQPFNPSTTAHAAPALAESPTWSHHCK
jgi:hypothetical protein